MSSSLLYSKKLSSNTTWLVTMTCLVDSSYSSEHSNNVLAPFNSKLNGQCKAVRPCPSDQSKKRITESGSDLNTILRCFLLFKTVVESLNILVFKIIFPLPKKWLSESPTLLWASLYGLIDRMYNLSALVLQSDAKPRLKPSTAPSTLFSFSCWTSDRCTYPLHLNSLHLERSFFSPYRRQYGVFLIWCLYLAFLLSFQFVAPLNQKGDQWDCRDNQIEIHFCRGSCCSFGQPQNILQFAFPNHTLWVHLMLIKFIVSQLVQSFGVWDNLLDNLVSAMHSPQVP